MERIPTKNQPKLFEAVIQEMQQQLGAGLPWLAHVFGKAERTAREYAARRDYNDRKIVEAPYYVPSVYVGDGKYESINPDAKSWGNYAFFYMEEPQDLSEQHRVSPYFLMEGDVNLVVWGDSRDIEAEDDRNLESIKSALLQVLGGMTLKSGRVTWNKVYEQDEKVFEAYSYGGEEAEYAMWPYFAFRIKGSIVCNSGCA